MLSFDEIVAEGNEFTRVLIARQIEEVRNCIRRPGYHQYYDDTTPHVFEEIGEALNEQALK